MRPLLALILAAFSVFLTSPHEAADASPVTVVHAYTYDIHHAAGQSTSSTTERAPPTAYDRLSRSDAVDLSSNGVSARLGGAFVPAPTTIHTAPGTSTQPASPTGTTSESARAHQGYLSSLRRSDVAANAGGAASKPLIIGENMSRVRAYADSVGGHAYRPWTNSPFDFGLGMRRNARMIKDAVRSGREIIDIGPDFARRAAGRDPSPFYNMERMVTDGYSGYTRVFERFGKFEGGVPGLDY